LTKLLAPRPFEQGSTQINNLKQHGTTTLKRLNASPYLQHDGVDDVRVLDGEIERHTPGGRERVALDPAPGYVVELLAVVDDEHGHERGDAGAERVAGEDELVLGAVPAQQVPQRLRLPLEDELGGLEQAVVHVAAVEHLHPELVVHEHLRRRRESVK